MERTNTAASKFLEMTIQRYQFDVVGWTEYCNDNKGLDNKALPVYREKPLEALRINDKLITPFSTPSFERVYSSKERYIQWLDEEYLRDQAFYEAILKNPEKYITDLEDELLNQEIDNSAKEYMKITKGKKIDEISLIKNIDETNWADVKLSRYPKVQLGVVLGGTEEAIINNFCVYFINQLKAHYAGGKTAFLSATGPASWHELDQCKAEVSYFKDLVVEPCMRKLE